MRRKRNPKLDLQIFAKYEYGDQVWVLTQTSRDHESLVLHLITLEQFERNYKVEV